MGIRPSLYFVLAITDLKHVDKRWPVKELDRINNEFWDYKIDDVANKIENHVFSDSEFNDKLTVSVSIKTHKANGVEDLRDIFLLPSDEYGYMSPLCYVIDKVNYNNLALWGLSMLHREYQSPRFFELPKSENGPEYFYYKNNPGSVSREFRWACDHGLNYDMFAVDMHRHYVFANFVFENILGMVDLSPEMYKLGLFFDWS